MVIRKTAHGLVINVNVPTKDISITMDMGNAEYPIEPLRRFFLEELLADVIVSYVDSRAVDQVTHDKLIENLLNWLLGKETIHDFSKKW